MKKKIPKIILILSFVPYVFTLLYGIYSMFNGFYWFFSTSYGFDAFRASTLLLLLMLFYIPVVPICLIYQLIYLSVCLMRKYNFRKIKIISGIITGVLVFGVILFWINFTS